MKTTKQRQLILDYFHDYPTFHPTAEEIYDYLKQQGHSIGIATIYRNLKTLVENGMLRELNLEKQGVHYDLLIHDHFHFVCTECGSIENFIIDELNHIDDVIEKITFGKVISKNIIINGICKDCLNDK